MLFNSYIFVFAFLPVALAGFFLLGRAGKTRAAMLWLVAASLFFYGWWNPKYLVLIVVSVAVNYRAGVAIHMAPRGWAKSLLAAGVVFDLALLGYFKYAHFFLQTADRLFQAQWNLAPILLPLGISFFTFTQIAYLVDAYRGATKEYDFLYYAGFVTFFPHLIAGPIVSYRRLMPQFRHPETYRWQSAHVADGLSLFTFGLAKKVVVADNLAPLSQYVFDHYGTGEVPFLLSWLGALAYTFQIYYDFSGYSDMAIGLARMFNVRFPLNFNSPYQATDIADFWRRWHITLSHFLRDHLYIPLGGNRRGRLRCHVNILATMLLGGLWHGAGWTYVIWGGLHGLYLVIHRIWRGAIEGAAWAQSGPLIFLGRAVTFLAVVVAWVFFRAHDPHQARTILAGMAGRHGLGVPYSLVPLASRHGWENHVSFANWSAIPNSPLIYLMLAAAAGVAFFAPNNDALFRLAEVEKGPVERPVTGRLWRSSVAWALATACVLSIDIQSMNQLSEFLYFRF